MPNVRTYINMFWFLGTKIQERTTKRANLDLLRFFQDLAWIISSPSSAWRIWNTDKKRVFDVLAWAFLYPYSIGYPSENEGSSLISIVLKRPSWASSCSSKILQITSCQWRHKRTSKLQLHWSQPENEGLFYHQARVSDLIGALEMEMDGVH